MSWRGARSPPDGAGVGKGSDREAAGAMELGQIWHLVREELRGQMTRATFEHLLQGATLLVEQSDAHMLTVALVNPRARGWLNRPVWQCRIDTLATAVTRRPMRVYFVVAAVKEADEEESSRFMEPGRGRGC